MPELDFSQFHPLDHRIGSRYCRQVTNFPTAPKGWRNVITHATMAWEYKLEPRLHRELQCRIGRHRFVTWYRALPEYSDALRGELPPKPGEPDDLRWNKGRSCMYCHRDE